MSISRGEGRGTSMMIENIPPPSWSLEFRGRRRKFQFTTKEDMSFGDQVNIRANFHKK